MTTSSKKSGIDVNTTLITRSSVKSKRDKRSTKGSATESHAEEKLIEATATQ